MSDAVTNQLYVKMSCLTVQDGFIAAKSHLLLARQVIQQFIEEIYQ